MPASVSNHLQRIAHTDEHAAYSDRAWFLLDCAWHDPVWVLRPTNVLTEHRPVRLHWDFSMPGGRVFTDNHYASLLESSRRLIAVIRRRSLSNGLSLHSSTVAGHFCHLRILLRWMARTGFTSFSDFDATSVLQFQRALKRRAGKKEDRVANTTVQKYFYLFTYLYRFSDEIGDGLNFDPFPGRSPGDVAGVRDQDIGRMPHTPDAVAVALITRSIDLLNNAARVILKARQIYADAMASAELRGYCRSACSNSAVRALRQAALEIPGRDQPLVTVKGLAQAIEMLYAACFVVIAYLVGARACEILHLKAGCVQQHRTESALTVIVGAIFKGQREYHGRPHHWIAPPPAVQAIAVLETLSEGHRRQAGRDELWLRSCGSKGATEWRSNYDGEWQVPSSERMLKSLRRFASWIDLPDHDGKPWRLSTYQGRKTFVRFVGMRDRSALFAVAQQLGHRERAVTDVHYCGSDYRLKQHIEAEVLEQSVTAWEHMLTASSLGGCAGREIIAKRPRFRGARVKEDIASFARTLADAGLTLGVCDWGYCVYREEYSACLGNAAGPNPVRREPSTCARCKNFVVSEQHRQYWQDQVDRHEALLNEPALPRQTLRIARSRLEEARKIVRELGQTEFQGVSR